MSREQGLIKLIILIIIALVVLSYFGFDIKNILESDLVKKNFGYLWSGVENIWKNYLTKPLDIVWGVFYHYIWLSFIENIERIKEGSGPTMLENIPTF